MLKALELGYRHLDCASFYKNEKQLERLLRNLVYLETNYLDWESLNDFQGLNVLKLFYEVFGRLGDRLF